MIIKAFEIIQEKFDKEIMNRRVTKVTAQVFFAISTPLLIVVVFRPADSQVPLYKKIYTDYTEPITLYYVKDNPYHRVLDIYYYKRKDLTIKEISV